MKKKLKLIFEATNFDRNKQKLEKDIVSADFAISRCIQDPTLNFRDVYKDVTVGYNMEPEDAVKLRKSKGSPLNL